MNGMLNTQMGQQSVKDWKVKMDERKNQQASTDTTNSGENTNWFGGAWTPWADYLSSYDEAVSSPNIVQSNVGGGGMTYDSKGNLVPIEGFEETYGDSVVNGEDATLKTINNQFNDGDVDYTGKNTAVKITGVPDDTTDNVVTSERSGPFRSLFDKMRENRQARQAERQKRRDARPERGRAGFRNIGSAQFDERAFFNEGQVNDEGVSLETVNPNYGKLARYPVGHEKAGEIVDRGMGLFGKEGGFMSKFGTGRGAMSGLLGSVGGEVGDTLSRMGEDMMYGGGYEYGDFYDTGDE